MGIRLFKSIRVGKHSRINLSRRGVGFSTGVKGMRVRYTPKKHSGKSSGESSGAGCYVYAKSGKSKGVALTLCIFAGYLGAHHFYAGNVGKGILYLCTGGLLFVGWFRDIAKISHGRFLDGKGAVIC